MIKIAKKRTISKRKYFRGVPVALTLLRTYLKKSTAKKVAELKRKEGKYARVVRGKNLVINDKTTVYRVYAGGNRKMSKYEKKVQKRIKKGKDIGWGW